MGSIQDHGNPARLQFAETESGDGVEFYDPIENARYVFVASEPVAPTIVSQSDPLYTPVDTTVDVESEQLAVPEQFDIIVRSADGDHLRTVEDSAEADIPEFGRCVLELTSTPIKFYVAGAGPVSINRVDNHTVMEFSNSSVTIGARSLHKRPGRSLTTTKRPADLMRVVGEFSAALKGTSPERTYPTLRGHPPAVEVGESLDIPGDSQRPETGVTIEIPPNCGRIFTVASLTYFLGAELQPGGTAQLVTDTGFEYSLAAGTGESFADVVADVLQHCFLLDCITRTEGIFPVRLAAREYAEDVLDVGLDFDRLYDQPIADRVEAYLSVSMDQFAPVRPEWRLTVDMPADPSYADCLPYLVNELAIIRCYEPGEKPTANSTPVPAEEHSNESTAETMDEFARGQATVPTTGLHRQSGMTRSTDSRDLDSTARRSNPVSQDDLFRIREADTVLHSYLGDGVPVGANKASKEAFKRQLPRDDSGSPEVGVVIVCNDTEMNEETAVEDIYTGSDLLRINGEVRENLTVEELKRVFEQDSNLVHYIGHVDAAGLQCEDGYLDVETLDSVGATAFILNGCRSFRQGSKLIEKGAFGGLVTVENVGNSLATEVGHNIAKLLNAGWPLDGALSVIQDDALIGRDYTILGDGTTEISTLDFGARTTYIVRQDGDDRYNVEPYTFPTQSKHLGSIYRSELESDGIHYLLGGVTGSYSVSRGELQDTFQKITTPVITKSGRQSTVVSLHWSDELACDLSALDEDLEQ
jgi:hypothetical protein